MIAHALGGTGLPASAWMLAYGGVAVVLLAALALRATAPSASPAADLDVDTLAPAEAATGALASLGRLLGLVVFVAITVIAFTGEDSSATNLVPVAVLVVWWVGLPILCLLVGDLQARVNPFDEPVAILRRALGRVGEPERRPPSWTAALGVGAFAWFLLAYHRPSSPRAVGVFLVVYAVAAVAGGVLWGRRWLRGGDGFGVLSAGVASIGLRRSTGARSPGVGGVAAVLLGSTAFDAVANTSWWGDVLGGTDDPWTFTGFQTLGLLWMVAVAGGALLLTSRFAEQVIGAERGTLAAPLGVALLPLALGWFLAHDLTLLLIEGQNFLVLASDPLARGWDLFGTGEWTVEVWPLRSTWVRVAQLAALGAGSIGLLVLARAVGTRSSRPDGVRVLWVATGLALVSIVSSVLLLFSGVES